MDNFYVYAYLDPRKPGKFVYGNFIFDFEPFYVGKGKYNRITEGLVNKRENKFKIAKINKIKKSNLDVIYLKIYENLTEIDAFNYEMEIIKTIGRKSDNGPLSNIHKGGSGGDYIGNHPNKEDIIKKWRETRMSNIKNSITIVSKETKEKIKSYHKKRKELGIPYPKLSEETKKKISQGNKGKLKPKTEEHKLKLKKINLGKKRTYESKIKQSETCKKTLGKLKEKLKTRSLGEKNSNTRKYTLKLIPENKTINIIGLNNLLNLYNEYSGLNYKDAPYLIKKIKDNKIENVKLINVININHKKS